MILPLTIRASEADATFACNGRLLVTSLVSRPDDDSGVEGEFIHHIIAQRAIKELGATPPEGGMPKLRTPKGFKLAAFSAWIPEWALAVIRTEIPADWSLMVETPIAYRYDLPRPVWVPVEEIVGEIPEGFTVRDGKVLIDHIILSGHIDIMGMSPCGMFSVAIDWKTGTVGADPAENNWQAAQYLGLCKRAWEELMRSKFILAQPKLDEESTGIPKVSSTELSGTELDAINGVLVENVNRALENRYETNSGQKQCRYCALALTRPWDCPSMAAELAFMKANLTTSALAALRDKPRDGALGDFVISGRTLAAPIKAATELLHERLDVVGAIDADCGTRITRTTRPGDYEVPDKQAFYGVLKAVLPEEGDRVECSTFGMTDIKKRIASTRGIVQKTVKPMEPSAEKVFDAELRPLVKQNDSRILIFT